jgi:hypothetical protein
MSLTQLQRYFLQPQVERLHFEMNICIFLRHLILCQGSNFMYAKKSNYYWRRPGGSYGCI